MSWGSVIGGIIGAFIHKSAKMAGGKSNDPKRIICPNCGSSFERNLEDIYCSSCGNDLRVSRVGTYTLIVLGAYALWFVHIFGIMTPEVQSVLLFLTGDEKFAHAGAYYSSVNDYSETLLFATIFTGGIFTVPIGFVAGKGYLDGTNGFGHIKAVLVGLLPALILNVIILTIYVF